MNQEQSPFRGFHKIREILGKIPFQGSEKIRGPIFHGLLWVLILVYLESVLHGVVFHSLTARYFYILGFSIPVALGLSLLLGLLPKRVNMGVSIALVSVLCVVFGSQLVYFFVFGNLYDPSMVSLGGDAIATFWKEMLLTMSENLAPLILCLLPIPVVCLVCRFLPDVFQGIDWHSKAPWRKRTDWISRAALAAVTVAVQVAMVLSLSIGGTGFYSAYSFYHSNDVTMKQATDTFGLLTALRLELTHPGSSVEVQSGYYAELPPVIRAPKPDTSGDGLSGEDQPPEYGWNVLDIDFDTLNGLTENETLLALNSYISSLTGTQQNEYTGMLADYNLIVLCAESFSTAAIDPEVTPTLYRLAHEGFVFNNYYNAFPNNTTDGEYSLCMGLMPDNTRGKTASSFYASRNSYLPMALGNIFNEQRGIQAYGYHNYVGSFYGRDESHPNMGYKLKFAGSGMKFTTSWPSSDLEMMEQSVSDYIGQGQFHAYYMTFSGHYKYDRWVNPMASRNYDQVRNLPYSETSKCYLSCNLELEKAMAYLMEQLEEAGVADKTAIVMAGDHVPYGLTNWQYSELMGYDCDFFERYHDTLIFWVGGLEEPIQVDTYCCNIDVLPTILNLWGFEYDSRLLAGTDVFSDGNHVAVLVDQSFATDKVRFNTSTGTATWLVPQEELPEGYLEGLIRLVKNKFSFSTDILNTAYYNFIFDEGAVKVNKSGWISQRDWDIQFGAGVSDDDDEPEETTFPQEPQEGTAPEAGSETQTGGQTHEAPPATVPDGQGQEPGPGTPTEGQTPEQPPEGEDPEGPSGTVPEGQDPEPSPSQKPVRAPWIPPVDEPPQEPPEADSVEQEPPQEPTDEN